MVSDSFKNFAYKLFPYKLLMYKHDLALNRPQGFICHKKKKNICKQR